MKNQIALTKSSILQSTEEPTRSLQQRYVFKHQNGEESM